MQSKLWMHLFRRLPSQNGKEVSVHLQIKPAACGLFYPYSTARKPWTPGSTTISVGNATETYEVHNKETFANLEASLEALKQIIHEQRAQIRVVEHERDLLAAGYKAATKKCAELQTLVGVSGH